MNLEMWLMIDLSYSRPGSFHIECCDGSHGLLSLPDKSVKLIYGSPPYPNASRNYGNWDSDQYIDFISPFIINAIPKLSDDGFIVINIKANRDKNDHGSTTRSLVVEKLAIKMQDEWGLSCVDIEIWVKTNPVPTGLRVACQDSYEQILWFSKSPSWSIDIDSIRHPYSETTSKIYSKYEYKPRSNGLTYVRKNKKITPNPLGALPQNVIIGSISSNRSLHQAVQPRYLSNKYILATSSEGDIIVDPWMGSGTTGLECCSLNRIFIGFDINSDCFDIAANNLRRDYVEF